MKCCQVPPTFGFNGFGITTCTRPSTTAVGGGFDIPHDDLDDIMHNNGLSPTKSLLLLLPYVDFSQVSGMHESSFHHMSMLVSQEMKWKSFIAQDPHGVDHIRYKHTCRTMALERVSYMMSTHQHDIEE